MKPLEDIYKGGFFKKRHRLNWRAAYWCPAVLKVFAPSCVIDVGCAVGELVKWYLDHGVDAYGLEGSRNCLPFLQVSEDRVLIRDLRLVNTGIGKFDLVQCLEVAEHIEPEYASTFVDNLCSLSDSILITAAPPGQRGHYHVNCQYGWYWIEKFKDVGYSQRYEKVEEMQRLLEPVRKKKEMSAWYRNMRYFERVKHG